MEKVSFVNKISTLMKATSDDTNPIPGYLYQEVNKITFESEGYCESTLEFLVDRLNKQSCHVKFKVLKLMKYVVENGASEFRHGLLKCSHGIREATKFSGPEDPLHGNVPNKAVRKIAQELSQLLFDIEKKQTVVKTEQKTEPDTSRFTGLGNVNTSPKGKLQGFGSSPTKTKTGFLDKLSKLAGSFQDKTKEQQAAILASIESRGDYRPPSLPVMLNKEPDPLPDMPESKVTVEKPVQHIPGKVGGGWDDDDNDGVDDENDYKNDIGCQATSLSSQDGDQVIDKLETWFNSEEENLVQRTLNSGDVPLLTIQEIRDFMSSCQNLNCEKIVEMLNCQLKSSSHIVVMKSLILLEYMMNSGLVSWEYICRICQEQLLLVSNGEKSTSSSKAEKILLCLEKLLNVKLFTKDNALENQLVLMED